jgi:2-polyprenyl-3-methyl-5-hydroxy-6-metoxy-1,4-benzoquinol methylase
MTTDYDQIAKEYQASKLQPWRTHIERFTLLRLTGKVAGLRALDLACGEGYYTRLLRRLGAGPVTGVDLSQGMIDLARAQEAKDPLDVQYEAADARVVDQRQGNDLVFAAYLLNYAQDYDELLAMCQAIAQNLKPGGRFVTVNNHPGDPPANFATGRMYGYSKQLDGPLVDGAPIHWRFHLPEGTIQVTNYYLAPATMERAMTAAGLRDIRWHPAEVSPEGRAQWGDAHWQPFLAQPPIAFLDCVK